MIEVKEYRYNKTFLNIYLGVSIFCGAFIIIMFIITQGRSLMLNVSLIIPIILYFLFKNYVVIKVYNDYFELRRAPLRSIDIIKFNEIESIEQIGKKIFFNLKNGVKIPIYLTVFDKDEREEVVSFFSEKINNKS